MSEAEKSPAVRQAKVLTVSDGVMAGTREDRVGRRPASHPGGRRLQGRREVSHC